MQTEVLHLKLSNHLQVILSRKLQILKKENARLILGRKVKIMFPSGNKSGKVTGIIGDILAVKVRSESENDYSVHVKFETLASSLLLDEIIVAIQRQYQVEV